MSRLADPQEDRYIYTDCGHECYKGEVMYTSRCGETLCCNCIIDRVLEQFQEMTISAKATLTGFNWMEVSI